MNGFLKTAFIVSAKCEKELYLLGYSLGSLRDFKSFSPMDNIRYLFSMLHEDSPPLPYLFSSHFFNQFCESNIMVKN